MEMGCYDGKFKDNVDMEELILNGAIDCLISEDEENYYFFNNGDRMGINKKDRGITIDFVSEGVLSGSKLRMRWNQWFVKGYTVLRTGASM